MKKRRYTEREYNMTGKAEVSPKHLEPVAGPQNKFEGNLEKSRSNENSQKKGHRQEEGLNPEFEMGGASLLSQSGNNSGVTSKERKKLQGGGGKPSRAWLSLGKCKKEKETSSRVLR